MDNENEQLVSRALYKQIKSMNRSEMEKFIRSVYDQGCENAETYGIDYDSPPEAPAPRHGL